LERSINARSERPRSREAQFVKQLQQQAPHNYRLFEIPFGFQLHLNQVVAGFK
jgi:hypothetical protein